MAALLAACSDSTTKAKAQDAEARRSGNASRRSRAGRGAEARGTVDMAKLLEPGALPDRSIGKADAKVTIVEYASMTCPHCAHFHATTLPALKTKYIDPGKVRLILREFPFDPRAEAGFMLARCAGDNYFPMVDVLFKQQMQWAGVENSKDALLQIAKLAGFTQEKFEACLTDQKLLEEVRAVRDRARRSSASNSTPTFFINGGRYPGALSIDEISAIIDRCSDAPACRRASRASARPGVSAMKFNRLRLLGFKSFVEPAEFVIERGLTGVVGPNGCGKSNLVEALRWVMGESSYKNMRASGMDDVIFSGSATRPSRNTAEVTLFLDNTDRTAPAAFNDADELQVSRRIEREAGSIYRINGKEARARDVQLLFADQSTGARSPSMVGQGRIGELIQAKPQARRALLEEAAGISGLHTRRHEAELRLRAAEQNLERLDDVVGELESADRQPEAAGAAGVPLQEPLRRDPQGRGDAAASALDAGQGARGGGAIGAWRPRRRWSPSARRRR